MKLLIVFLMLGSSFSAFAKKNTVTCFDSAHTNKDTPKNMDLSNVRSTQNAMNTVCTLRPGTYSFSTRIRKTTFKKYVVCCELKKSWKLNNKGNEHLNYIEQIIFKKSKKK